MQNVQPMIIGHRGAAGEAPENTLSSFSLALEQGCQGIELDVHISADGRLMVCHDSTLNRTTDLTGPIHGMTAEDIRKADAGAWFAEKFRGEKIPYLEEVYELVPTGVMINVEVKEAYDGRIEPVLLEFLLRSGRMANTVVSSFDHKLLVRLKKQEPTLRIGLLYAANLVDHAIYAATLGVEVFSLHPYHELIEAYDVASATNHELAVYPYTANREEDYRRLIRSGVSGIITDYPARLAGILQNG
jgi:glycerophosphoryl diester phosphodiesterase